MSIALHNHFRLAESVPFDSGMMELHASDTTDKLIVDLSQVLAVSLYGPSEDTETEAGIRSIVLLMGRRVELEMYGTSADFALIVSAWKAARA